MPPVANRDRLNQVPLTLFANKQQVVTRLVAQTAAAVPETQLVGLELATQRVTMRIDPPSRDWSFRGCPILADKMLYVSMSCHDVHQQLYVGCYDAATGTSRWRRPLVTITRPMNSGGELHLPLTLTDGLIVCNTNEGAIAAVDTVDGAIAWLTTYPTFANQPRRPYHPDWHAWRKPDPCAAHGDQLFCARTDCPVVFALDTMTGRLRWQARSVADQLGALALLGVGGDCLIAAGQRLGWIDTETGRLNAEIPSNPFPADSASAAVGRGRGVIAGDLLYWPARGETDQVNIFNVHTGQQLGPPLKLNVPGQRIPAGHLSAAEGHLIISSAGQITVLKAVGVTTSQ